MRKLLTLTIFTLVFTAIAIHVQAQELLGSFSEGYLGGDHFGSACSGIGDLDGDGVRDLIIGARYADPGGQSVGRLYAISGSTLSVLYSLDGTDVGGGFGSELVALSDLDADGFDDFIVAAPSFDGPNGSAAGEVTVVSGHTGALLRVHDGEAPADYFGQSMTAIDDLDGDGVDEYIIGAWAHTVGSLGIAGKVYAYSGASGATIFTISGTASYQAFGTAIAAVGDIDLDGLADFAVSSIGSTQRGRIDLYSGASQAIIGTLQGQAPDDAWIGRSLAGERDFDGDGISDLVAGDPFHLTNGADSGGVFVYSGATLLPIFSWLGASSMDQFGIEVRVLDDANGDGIADVLIGSTTGYKKRGEAYLYSGRTGLRLFRFDGEARGSLYGQQVGSAGDINGDGLTDLLIGAEDDSKIWFNAGRVYLYAGNDLFLRAVASTLSAGDTLTLNSYARDPASLTAMAVTDVSGAPTFLVFDFGTSDSQGLRTFSSTVPSGLAGIDVGVQSFATDARSGTISSYVQHLTFQ